MSYTLCVLIRVILLCCVHVEYNDEVLNIKKNKIFDVNLKKCLCYTAINGHLIYNNRISSLTTCFNSIQYVFSCS